MSQAQRKLFYNLRRMRQGMGAQDSAEAAEIARELDVAQSDVWEMDMRFSGGDSSFGGYGGDKGYPVPAGYLVDSPFEPFPVLGEEDNRTKDSADLYAALGRLDSLSRDIVSRRWLADEKITLQDLALEYGLSAERVRQIEAAALRNIRTLMPHWPPLTGAFHPAVFLHPGGGSP